MNVNMDTKNQELLPAILVLNRKYYPCGPQEAFSVGATLFTLEVANFFMEHNLLKGYLFYQRDETLSYPEVLAGDGQVTVRFHFRMPAEVVCAAIGKSIRLLTGTSTGPVRALVYYQTDTLLQYHPATVPHCVTHHGPFVDAFSACYSYEEACDAFETPEKARHLQIQQGSGIRALIRSPAFVLTHSAVQHHWLVGRGVSERRIASIVPPVFLRPAPPCELPAEVADFAACCEEEAALPIVFAVARLDRFKNAEMLVDAAQLLLQRGRRVRVLIAGDEELNASRRAALLARVAETWRSAFVILPRLAHPALVALFDAFRGRAVFVCTSRYETLGITPLEAALHGLCTLMPALPQVEASALFPPLYHYVWTVAGLTDRLTQVLDGEEQHDGEQLAEVMSARLNPWRFDDSMMQAWRQMSQHFLSALASVD